MWPFVSEAAWYAYQTELNNLWTIQTTWFKSITIRKYFAVMYFQIIEVIKTFILQSLLLVQTVDTINREKVKTWENNIIMGHFLSR